MDSKEQKIAQWLEETSDDDQVGGSESETQLSDSSDNEENNGRNSPQQKWSKFSLPSDIITQNHKVMSNLPGIKSEAKLATTALECFTLFFSDDVFSLLVKCTNQHIEEVRTKFHRERDAKYTDVEEIKAFLGLLIMSGVLRASYLSFKDYWATDGTGVEMFRITMNYKRFRFLFRCLRFDDKTTRAERLQYDNLAAIRQICDLLLANFQEAYTPSGNLSIDEQLIGFRGRFKGKVKMPNKPNKYCIKIQALVDSNTFYLVAFEVYPGKQPAGPYQVSNSTEDIVKRLVEPIKGLNCNVVTNNFDRPDTASSDQPMPDIVNYYNSTIESVDNSHLYGTYNIGKRTKRWPLTIFFHLINVAVMNALVIHRTNTDKLSTHMRRQFLRQLSVELVYNHQKRRLEVGATPKIVKKRIMEVHEVENYNPPTTVKRGRCNTCPRKRDRKIQTKCIKCAKFVCNDHSQIYCQHCDKIDLESS